MSKERFDRLETRVDEIKDDLAEVKAEQKVMHNSFSDLRQDITRHTEEVKSHVAGDNKIIIEIMPLIAEMKELVDDHKFNKEAAKRKQEKLVKWRNYLAFFITLSTVIGIIKGFNIL